MINARYRLFQSSVSRTFVVDLSLLPAINRWVIVRLSAHVDSAQATFLGKANLKDPTEVGTLNTGIE